MRTRMLLCLSLVIAMLPLAAVAKDWTPPATLKVKWPSIFQNKGMALSRIAEAEDFICARASSGKLHYVYAAKATPNGMKADAAAKHGEKKGKFDIVEAKAGEARLKRGGAIAWISFSIRAMRTTAVIKASKPKSEVFYELEIPPTSFPSSGDWTKLCNEAQEMIAAGVP